MSEQFRYKRLGSTLGRMAYERGLTGPYFLADYLKEWAEKTGYEGRVPARNTISDYYRGKAKPQWNIVELITQALDLTEREQEELAWVYTFPFAPAA